MKRWFRSVLLALEGIRDALGGVVNAVHELHTEPAMDATLESRVAALERELERRHAEAEGLLLKAQGKFDAARAAEERTRRLAESAAQPGEGEEDLDEQAIIEAYEQVGLPLSDAAGSEENGMHTVPSRMETRRSSKQNAHRAKFGV